MKWLLLSLLIGAAWAADYSAELLAAASKGETTAVQSLLQSGANVDATDKNNRTPLMLAAQHGHAEIVRALLAAGAKTDVRDKSGWTAYGLALFEPAGHGNHEAVLKMLPAPPRYRLAAIAGWNPARLVSSCFQRREQIIQLIGLMKPDEALLRELQAYIKGSGKGLAQLAQVDAKGVEPLKAEPSGEASLKALFGAG